MELLIGLGLFFPLISFIGLMASSKWIKRQLTGMIASGVVLTSFICFLTLLIIYKEQKMSPFNLTLFSWIPVEGINADFMLRLDPLSLVMTLVITGVGFLIHLYSIGYMDHEEDLARYFACMNFFVFAMLLLVLAGHLLLLFVGWEGVGLASYLLIGFWYQRPAAAQAATKAFVINRIGDFGLLLGLLLTFSLFHTGDIEQVSQQAKAQFAVGAPILTLLTFLYFWGAIGKSAQLPLYTWLPEAMEGPTPVSALIHAATMVTAGVYLVVRMHEVFIQAPATLLLVGIIGGVTSLFAAICAIGQTDLKRVLAYSTVSQLVLMFLAAGIGAFYAAMFHLVTHAFIKSLLFLSAGNVVHRMHGNTDMRKMGGLSKVFTKTHWLFLIGVLALSGLPPLAAFFSKDLILEQEYLSGFYILFTIGLVASILTGFYLMRAYCLSFMGKKQDSSSEIKEAPAIMIAPLIVLSLFSIGGGFLDCPFCANHPFESFLEEIGIGLAEELPASNMLLLPETWLSIVGAFLGVGSALYIYTRYRDRSFPLLENSFYVNEIYQRILVNPLKAFSKAISEKIEPQFFEGMMDRVVHKTQSLAYFLQRMQSGQMRSYVAWTILGMVFLMVYLVL
jgi:NADH-quinone oxidoreductase subunit L